MDPPCWLPPEMLLIADDILIASSLLAFQSLLCFTLLSAGGRLTKLSLGVRVAVFDGRSLQVVLFKKLLFSMLRSGEFSVFDSETLTDGAGPSGELLLFFDRNPVLNLSLFF